MKSILCVILLGLSIQLVGQVDVMTYNIRYDNPEDGPNWWEHRKAEIADFFQYYQSDIFGLQEALPHQTEYIDTQLENYAFFGYGRDGLDTQSEAAPIFYDSTRFDLIRSEVFWLSNTPTTISKGWDAALNRVVTYCSFRNRVTEESIHIFNAHFDHRGEIARQRSADLILRIIQRLGIQRKPLIVMGDFNCPPGSIPYEVLNSFLDDGMDVARQGLYGPIGTWNGFDPNMEMTNRIDYIFIKGMEVSTYRHIDDRRKNNLHLSDHLPVLIQIDDY